MSYFVCVREFGPCRGKCEPQAGGIVNNSVIKVKFVLLSVPPPLHVHHVMGVCCKVFDIDWMLFDFFV